MKSTKKTDMKSTKKKAALEHKHKKEAVYDQAKKTISHALSAHLGYSDNTLEFLNVAIVRSSNRKTFFDDVGFKGRDGLEIDSNIRECNVSISVIPQLAKKLELKESEVLELINISSSTLSRRKKTRKNLTPAEADRVYRVASTVTLAVNVLGDLEKSIHWLKTPAYFLGNKKPINLMETEPGTDEVKKLLLRVEHSVYS